jgi:hypothetical protein
MNRSIEFKRYWEMLYSYEVYNIDITLLDISIRSQGHFAF